MIRAYDRTDLITDYWLWDESERSVQRDAEISYLRAALAELAPGRHVADLGCGLGMRAIALARAGFEVVGLDVSPWAVDGARQRQDGAGTGVQWATIGPFVDAWPIPEVDAAICVDWFGWNSEATQRKLLAQARRHLAPEGVLIVVESETALNDSPGLLTTATVVGKATYRLERNYDALSGYSHEQLTVSGPGVAEQVLAYSRRLYSTVELAALLRQAGFAVDQVSVGAPDANGARSLPVRIIARPLSTPPQALAVYSWRTPPGEGLDLRYAPDETEWLDPKPADIWQSLVESERDRGADAAGHYAVDDPYGAERAASVVGTYFNCPVSDHQLTFGPGVTSLLHGLCDLADGGLVIGPQLTHPDLTAWAVDRGLDVHMVGEPGTFDHLVEEVRRLRPSLVHLDRPNFAGELLSLDALETLATEARRVGAIVLVDESPATYLGPGASSVPLIHRLDNLVVLRSVTKAYSMGGLRIGYALASAPISLRVRELVCPLQVAELSYRALLRLLPAGDIFGRLRARVRVTKPATTALLEALGFEVIEGHPEIPWVLVPDAGGTASARLDRMGVRGLPFVPSPAVRGPYPELLHLTVPLSEERLAAVRRHLTGGQAPNNGYANAPITSWSPDRMEYRSCLPHWRHI